MNIRVSRFYQNMITNLQKSNKNLKISYFGQNKHFDEFIGNCNIELLSGIELVK